MKIKLLSTDFDGTLVSHVSEPVLDRECMELIRDLQGERRGLGNQYRPLRRSARVRPGQF